MPAGPFGLPGSSDALKRSLHDHWLMYFIEGIVLVILGAAAVALPPLAGIAATIILGWLFLIGGFVGLVSTFGSRAAPGFGWSLLSAILAIGVGFILLWNPLGGLVTLTYVLIIYFIVEGVFSIGLALSHRRELGNRWEWMAFNGVIDLVLAAIIIAGLPGTFAWALGLLVGIDLVFGGIALISMAMAARQNL